MKKYSKQPIPPAYKKWFDENNERFQTSSLKAENTINVFNLDNPYLRKARADAYKRVNKLLESEFLEEMTLEDIYGADKEGKLDPYCFVAAYVFKKWME